MSEQEMDVEMDELERALTKALRRVDAPEGFAEKVVGRACAAPMHEDGMVMNGAAGMGAAPAQVSEARPGAPGVVAMQPRRWPVRMQAWMGGAIAAALALGMFGAEQIHLRRERAAQAAAANEQFDAAVRVTDRALAQTREQLQRAGLNLGE